MTRLITELNQSGAKTRTFVYQGSEVLAWQKKNGTTETIAWEHRDPSQASVRGDVAAELEPMGNNAGVSKGFTTAPPRSQATLEAERTYPFFAATTSGQCIIDGIETPCSMAGGEATAQCPPEGCGPQWNPDLNNGKGGYDFFEATVTGNRYRHWVEPDRVTKYRPDGSVYGEVTYGEGHWAYTSAGSNHPESFLEHAANFGTFPQQTGQQDPFKGAKATVAQAPRYTRGQYDQKRLDECIQKYYKQYRDQQQAITDWDAQQSDLPTADDLIPSGITSGISGLAKTTNLLHKGVALGASGLSGLGTAAGAFAIGYAATFAYKVLKRTGSVIKARHEVDMTYLNNRDYCIYMYGDDSRTGIFRPFTSSGNYRYFRRGGGAPILGPLGLN